MKFILTAWVLVGFASVEQNKAHIRSRLMAIKSLPPGEYFARIDEYRLELEKYIDHKKRVCNGEFSTVVLGEGVQDQGEANKLSKRERMFCFSELRSLQTDFINNMHTARKNYLNHLHGQRLRQLEQSRRNLLKGLQRDFSQKN